MWPFRSRNYQQANEKWDKMNAEVANLTKEKKMDEAFLLGQKLFRFSRKEFGKLHEKTVTSLNNLGIICMLRKEFDESESYLLSALRIGEKVSGKFSREVVILNTNLAKLYMARAGSINEMLNVLKKQTAVGEGGEFAA